MAECETRPLNTCEWPTYRSRAEKLTAKPDADCCSPVRHERACTKLSDVSACGTDWDFSRREDFWFIVALRSEDEADIRAGEAAGRRRGQGHPARNTPAVLGRGEDPHRAGGPAGRGEHRRAVPA